MPLSKSQLDLIACVGRGEISRTVYLISQMNISADTADGNGNTLLHIAVQSDNVEMIKALIMCGANKESRNSNLLTPLRFALINRKMNAFNTLLSLGANTRDTDASAPVHWAVLNKDLDTLHLLLSAQASDINLVDNNGRTLLHTAMIVGDIPIANMLIGTGIQRERKDRLGYTAAHYLALYGLYNIASGHARSWGLDVNATALDGSTPLHLATGKGYRNTVTAFIECGASIDPLDREGMSPLHRAVESGDLQMVQLLLRLGANKNLGCRRDTNPNILLPYQLGTAIYNGDTPLHIAIGKKYTDIVTVLIGNGCDLDIGNTCGHSPLAIALNNGMLGYLMTAGVDVNKNGRIESIVFSLFETGSFIPRHGRLLLARGIRFIDETVKKRMDEHSESRAIEEYRTTYSETLWFRQHEAYSKAWEYYSRTDSKCVRDGIQMYSGEIMSYFEAALRAAHATEQQISEYINVFTSRYVPTEAYLESLPPKQLIMLAGQMERTAHIISTRNIAVELLCNPRSIFKQLPLEIKNNIYCKYSHSLAPNESVYINSIGIINFMLGTVRAVRQAARTELLSSPATPKFPQAKTPSWCTIL